MSIIRAAAKDIGQGIYTKAEVDTNISKTGTVNRVVHHTEYNYIVTTVVDWTKMIGKVVTIDTAKYDYIVEVINSVFVINGSVDGGANIQIRIGNTVVVSSGHRGHGMDDRSYFTEVTKTPLITSGFDGGAALDVNGYIAVYIAGKEVRTHNNGGANSTGNWANDKITLTIYELNK